jgi:hypothetical protein
MIIIQHGLVTVTTISTDMIVQCSLAVRQYNTQCTKEERFNLNHIYTYHYIIIAQ